MNATAVAASIMLTLVNRAADPRFAGTRVNINVNGNAPFVAKALDMLVANGSVSVHNAAQGENMKNVSLKTAAR